MIDAAIVGLGRWGQVLVEAVQGKSKKIRFIAGVARRPERVTAFAQRHGLSLEGDYDSVLATPEIRAVVLATPHTRHAEQAIAAARAGKHVFVEKPFTLTRASAEQVVAAAEQAGIVLAVGHNRRFLPAVAELRRRVEEGRLGDLLHVEANFSGNAALRYAPESWRASRHESPAGAMAGLGIHMIDLMIHLFGRIARVSAQSLRRAATIDIDDTTSMLLRFENGMSGYLGTLAATAPLWRLQVFGTEAWAELRDENTLAFRRIGTSEEEVLHYPPFDKERAELEAFAAAIGGESAYPLRPEEAVHGVSVFESIVRSAETDATIEIP